MSKCFCHLTINGESYEVKDAQARQDLDQNVKDIQSSISNLSGRVENLENNGTSPFNSYLEMDSLFLNSLSEMKNFLGIADLNADVEKYYAFLSCPFLKINFYNIDDDKNQSMLLQIKEMCVSTTGTLELTLNVVAEYDGMITSRIFALSYDSEGKLKGTIFGGIQASNITVEMSVIGPDILLLKDVG